MIVVIDLTMSLENIARLIEETVQARVHHAKLTRFKKRFLVKTCHGFNTRKRQRGQFYCDII